MTERKYRPTPPSMVITPVLKGDCAMAASILRYHAKKPGCLNKKEFIAIARRFESRVRRMP